MNLLLLGFLGRFLLSGHENSPPIHVMCVSWNSLVMTLRSRVKKFPRKISRVRRALFNSSPRRCCPDRSKRLPSGRSTPRHENLPALQVASPGSPRIALRCSSEERTVETDGVRSASGFLSYACHEFSGARPAGKPASRAELVEHLRVRLHQANEILRLKQTK